ncbi:MAG: hypothetical protein KIT58_10965 [Planctomycetota bacterium]|nr:hypothetical protein [Planctomycetota bacterium]
MGVIGTFCQVCGLPTQHDHYVPQPDGMLGIYRGGMPSQFTPVVAFGPEHAWLERALGLALSAARTPAVIRGRCSDGSLEDADGAPYPDGFVADGIDERAALHEACWRLAGEPASWDALAPAVRPHGLEAYQQQLFDLEALLADDAGWTLVDPDLDAPEGRRSRARISDLLGLLGR